MGKVERLTNALAPLSDGMGEYASSCDAHMFLGGSRGI